MGAFGGGIASTGNVCGILLGGVALISSMYSRGNLDEKENPRMWSVSNKFIKKFNQLTKDFGGNTCKDIARLDWSNRDAVKDYYTNPESRRKICIELTGEAAYILGKLLEKEKLR